METRTELSLPMRCSLCAKSFENRKSQLRHVSYCRKARSRVRSRKKACTACTKAKTRCDMISPECSRCLAKNIACVYSLPKPAVVGGHRLPENQSEIAGNHEFPVSNDESADAVGVVDAVDVVSLEQPSMQLVSKRTSWPPLVQSLTTNIDLASADSFGISRWSMGPVDTISPDTLANAEEIALSNSVEYSSKWSFPSNSLDFALLQPTTTENRMHSFNSPSHGDPITPMNPFGMDYMCDLDFDQVIPRSVTAFKPRKVPDRQFYLSKNYVLCNLRSYPYMMLPNRTPPPFIHPNYKNGNKSTSSNSGQAPLDVCAAIMQMYSVKTKDNTVFIWRTIKMEQERLMAECYRFSDRETVAALQAITIYFLLRITEDNDEATNFDVPMIDTMIALGVKAGGFIMTYDNAFKTGIPTWEDWIQAESLSRTMILLFLIDIFFDVSSPVQAYKCDGSQMLGLALPCGRDLWRASSRSEWEREYTSQYHGKKSLTYGDLMSFQGKKEGTFDKWLANLDEFGALVMTAASIPHWSEVVRRIMRLSRSN